MEPYTFIDVLYFGVGMFTVGALVGMLFMLWLVDAFDFRRFSRRDGRNFLRRHGVQEDHLEGMNLK